MEEEYFDYLKISKELENRKRAKINRLYCDYFHLPLRKIKELKTDIEKVLNIDSYSSKSVDILLNDKVDEPTKEAIRECQKQYMRQCHVLRCIPITDIKMVEHLLKVRNEYEKHYQFQLIKCTMWGSRLVQYFLSEMNIQDSNDLDEESIIQSVCAKVFLPKNILKHQPCCVGHNHQDIERHGWILFPVARSLDCELNQFFYHEMRHAVEDDTYFQEFYNMLNELRVETHAIKDKETLPFIFDSKENALNSVYVDMLPFTYGLFEEYGSLFDKWAISNNVHEQERVIKPKFLEEYDDIFSSAMNAIYSFKASPFTDKLNMNIRISEDKTKELVDEMKREIEKHLVKK